MIIIILWYKYTIPVIYNDMFDLRSMMLIALPEDVLILDKSFFAQKHPDYPWKPCLEEPDHFIKVVVGNISEGRKRTKCLHIPSSEGPHRASILTRLHREGWVGVREEVGGLWALVDEDQGGTPRHRGRGWMGQQQQLKLT